MTNQKSYLILEPVELNKLIANPDYHVFAVSIISWLIHELGSNQKDTLDRLAISLELIHVVRFGPGYPALGIVSDSMEYFDENYQQIEKIVSNTLVSKSFSDYLKFLPSNNVDWKQKTTELMSLK